MFLLWLILASISLFILYLIISSYKVRKFYEDQGIHFMGHDFVRFLKVVWKGMNVAENSHDLYALVRSKNERFGVCMVFGQPTFIIADVDLVKQILVKDFDHFVDRRKFGTGKDDLVGKMLLSVEGDHWKALRGKMSPTFTTGKIRRMFGIFEKSSNRMVTFVQKVMEEDGIVDLQEAYSKYTMDVIAAAAFGIDSKAFDSKEPSVFEKMGNKLNFSFSILGLLKMIFLMLFPKLASALGIALFSMKAQTFFSKVIKSTIKARESSSDEKRNDFIQLMLEARHGQLKMDETELNDFEKEARIVEKTGGLGSSNSSVTKVSLEDDDIAAQSILFILGGYDTTQGLLLFAAYNLAIYQDYQDRLLKEVQENVENNDGQLTYDGVNQMPFMDMFINETLRFYPPGVGVERRCTKDYKVPNSEAIIKKGDLALISVYSMQRDPRYFADPEKFDPERFSAKNKASIPTYAFLPFGHGPRNCIGMRLALTEVKVAIAQLVLNFVLEPSEKTPIPVKFSKTGALKPEGGLWLKMNSRN